jgi:hypothetical protein
MPHVCLPRTSTNDRNTGYTAQQMVKSGGNLSAYLPLIAEAYFQIYARQATSTFADFWGLREFYSTIRFINAALAEHKKALDATTVVAAVLRNFGGRPDALESVLREFYGALGLPWSGMPVVRVLDLIRDNIAAPSARHLMVLFWGHFFPNLFVLIL